MQTIALVILVGTSCWAAGAYGTWKMNGARSTFTGGPQPKSFTVRIEPHAKGEVFTMDRSEPDGRTTSSSAILYLDGQPWDIQDFWCSGTQSSRQVDTQSVEILRKCASGEWTRFIRRLTSKSELVLEITTQQPDGRRFERRLVLERQ